MFGKVYLPDHSFKLIYRFKFSEFPISLRPEYRSQVSYALYHVIKDKAKGDIKKRLCSQGEKLSDQRVSRTLNKP